MRAVPRPDDEPFAGNGHSGLDSMRAWLVGGVQLVDRRRRFGRHGQTRKLLVVDPQARSSTSEHWQSTTAALQRHTVSGAMTELEPEHRRVIQLAYIEGRSNREIAAALGVSVTTVKRRLLKALERLELYISAAGAWLAAMLIGFGAYLGTRLVRVVGPEATQRVASTAAVVTLAVAAVGVVTFIPDTASPRHSSAPLAAGPTLSVATTVPAADVDTGGPAAPTVARSSTHRPVRGSSSQTEAGEHTVSTIANHGSNGCHGNPTGAPGVPGHPNGHLGPPVNPPGKGGCKNL